MPESLHFVEISRRTYFSAAHLYHQPLWSAEKNRQVFGACFSAYGHGHNYTLEATFSGPIDPVSGLVVNLTEVERVLRLVVDPLEHKHLNFEVEFFKTHIPTTENIALYCFEQIQKHSLGESISLVRVRLYETEDIWATVTAM